MKSYEDNHLNLAIDEDAFSNSASVVRSAGFSCQIVHSGDAVGVYTVQVSNDGTNFDDLGGAKTMSAPGSHTWEFPNIQSRFARVKYVKTSGEGFVDVYINGKG